MIIVYRDGDHEWRWDLKQVKLLSSEAEAVERVVDMTWAQVKAKLGEGSVRALRAVAWVLAKRDEPTLRHSAFDPPEDDLDIDFDAADRAALRDAILKSTEISEDERAAALAELSEPEDADEPEQVEELPKASVAAASPTGD